MNEDSFQLTKDFESYVNKPEITDIGPKFLVAGSKNVLIDYAKRIISRNGYELFGAANNGGGSIRSSYEWDTSTAKQFPLRSYDGRLEFYWSGNETWNLLKSGFATSDMEFAKIWDTVEKIDILLWVIGDINTYKWSGGITKVWSSTPNTITKQGVLSAKTTISFVAGTPGTISPTILDSANNFINAGFVAGDILRVTGSTANSRNFTIASVSAGILTLIMSDTLVSEAAGPAITLHNGEPTWSSSRFLTTGTRSILYNGTEYSYTGGENTDTITGLTGFPAVTLGDSVWQASTVLANPGAIASGFKQDLIGVQLNQLILASTLSQEVYGSKDVDYTDFTLTSPRVPGDPFKVNADNYITCIVPIDNKSQTTSSLAFGAGTSEFFQFSYQLSQDNTNELVRMVKLKTAVGSGLISKDAICPIKNNTVYVSREPAFDSLENIEENDARDVPISDPIKNDFDNYGTTGFNRSHVKYWKRSLYIALPAMGLVLIFDLMRKLWQPPQTIPISRLAVIDDWLHGHSSISNETFRLFTGSDDNGVFIPQVARFAYNNGGRRDRIKNMSEYWSDGYITPNGTLEMTMNFGFNGSVGKRIMTILGNDSSIVTPQTGSTLGDEPLGATPIGGANLETPVGIMLQGSATMLRFWQEDTLTAVDYIEHFIEYKMNTLGGQFALVAHGSNQWDAGTSPVSHKK